MSKSWARGSPAWSRRAAWWTPVSGVRVLEARARLGGRIHTDLAFAEVPTERGAEFIDGSRARVWHYLERFGLQARPGLGMRASGSSMEAGSITRCGS
jgi:monoamine oxidase